MATDKHIVKAEPVVFSQTILSADPRSPLYTELWSLFSDEMRRAVKYGRICTPERMSVLYPIFREINIEQDLIASQSARAGKHKKRQR